MAQECSDLCPSIFSFSLFFFPNAQISARCPEIKCILPVTPQFQRSRDHDIFTELTGPRNESQMWNLYASHKTLVQISENMHLSDCRELSLDSLFNQNSLTGITALDVIFVHILFYYVKTPDFFLFT